jgi:hypothetical protein
MPADRVKAETIGRNEAVASAGASSVFVYLIFAIGDVGFRAQQIYNFNEAMRKAGEGWRKGKDGRGNRPKNESHINVTGTMTWLSETACSLKPCRSGAAAAPLRRLKQNLKSPLPGPSGHYSFLLLSPVVLRGKPGFSM